METHDDAGVYQLSPELALIQTVDFFTPIVDDPFDFGAIAAANSFSDVYAMGGRPLTALNIVGWPQDQLPWDVLSDILRGAHETVHQAGAVLAGGHSVKAPELFFGLSVTGVIHPEKIVTNAAARPGDRLFLTKPIGTGVLTTALKKGKLEPEYLRTATATMRRLNDAAAEAMNEVGVSAATDITGFGLMGHLFEMASGSQVDVEIDVARVPLLPGALEHARAGDKPGGLAANRRHVEIHIDGTEIVQPPILDLLFDPQTSGGLLIAVPEGKAAQLASMLVAKGVQGVVEIGRVTVSGAGRISLKG
jgi:selenide,water dikinase